LKINTDKLARLISTLFVPPAFTIITFAIFAFLLENESQKQIIVILVAFIFGFVAPIALFIIFRKSGKLADNDALVKEERTIPFFIVAGFYAIGLVVLVIFKVNIISIAFWFCYISNTLLTILINRYEKISAHTMGAAGPMAAFTFVFGPIALFLILLVIIVGWARIKLECHTFIQVALGFFVAFISTYLQIFIIVRIFY
jgi:membrane-associated phospholipid phosphatase